MEIVLNTLNTKILKGICKAKWEDLLIYGDEWALPDDLDSKFIFKDNGADVLMVAHTDTVYPPENFYDLSFAGKRTIMNAGLDDRLGVFTICEFLPSLIGNNVYDILLTDGEERGKSTAVYFEPPRQYNWIVEFDRHSDDLVFYQYGGNTDAVRELKKVGFKIGIGSFSDIAELEHCGATAFNIGVGYVNEHSPMAYMIVEDYLQQIKHFVKFWNLHKDTFFPLVKSAAITRYPVPYANPYRYDDDDSGWPQPKHGGTSNSLSPQTWNNGWYKGEDGVWRTDTSDQNGLCEICDSVQALKKVGDIYLCEECRVLFRNEIFEYEDDQLKKKDKGLNDDSWLECDGCGCCWNANQLAYVDFNDGLGEQLFCRTCRSKYDQNYKSYPLTGTSVLN